MWWLAVKRKWYKRRCDQTVMRHFLAAPLPVNSHQLTDVEFLVVDLETTDLSAENGEIASIGWVVISKGVITLSSAEHHFCKVKAGVGQSAVFHHIRDSELDNALTVTEIMERFLEVAAGRVLVFHNASLDMGFLNRVSQKLYGMPILAPVVDTLLLEQRRLLRANKGIKSGELRLHYCRQRYGLPDYPAHDALTDALATAELLSAWAIHAGGKQGVRLKQCFV